MKIIIINLALFFKREFSITNERMTENFTQHRLIIATIAALIMHMAVYCMMGSQESSPVLNSNLFSQNISIKFSDIFIEKTKPLNVISKKPIITQKKTAIIQKEVAQVESSNQEISESEVMVTSEFKLNGMRVAPQYPKRALRLKQEGVVYLRILISELGVTEKIIFAQKSQYALLNKAALKAVSQWKFQPSIIDGVATKTWIEVPVEFKIT